MPFSKKTKLELSDAYTQFAITNFPVDTGRKLNVHKTFRRRPGRLMDVQFTSCVYWGRFFADISTKSHK